MSGHALDQLGTAASAEDDGGATITLLKQIFFYPSNAGIYVIGPSRDACEAFCFEDVEGVDFVVLGLGHARRIADHGHWPIGVTRVLQHWAQTLAQMRNQANVLGLHFL